MYQNEHGTWHREDLADHLPSMEQRRWFCSDCWQRLCEAAKLTEPTPIVLADRVPDVSELKLRAAVRCFVCGSPLERNAYVEVY